MGRIKQQHLKQRKDGRYFCRYKDQWFTGYDEKEVLRAREDYKLSLQMQPDPDDNETTVGSYARSWLPTHRISVQRNTYNAYVGYMNRLIIHLGKTPMKDVRPSDIKALYNAYLGMSDSSVRKARMLYVDMWDSAIEDGIVKSNPCRAKSAKPHKGTVGTHRQLTREEDELILSVSHPLRAAVLTMRYAGIRRGEAMALDVQKDVDFNNDLLKIRSANHFEGNASVSGSPKTVAGIREIPMLSILKEELKGKTGLLAPSSCGKAMTSSAWKSAWASYVSAAETALNGCHKRWFGLRKEDQKKDPDRYQRICTLRKEAAQLLQKGLKQEALNKQEEAETIRLSGWKEFTVRPHDLRHSYCTMLRDAGVDMKLAILWMGHKDEKMILRIYDHVTEDRTKSAIKSLESKVAG